MKKVYVLYEEVCNDFDVERKHKIFKSRKRAIEELEKIVNEEKEINENSYNVEKHYEDFYCAYNEGYYAEEHVEYYVSIEPIIE